MNSSTLAMFAETRPFEPFVAYMADGREVEVRHPETVMVAQHALGLWILHEGGQVEVLDGESITAMRTLGPVDPDEFIGSAQRER